MFDKPLFHTLLLVCAVLMAAVAWPGGETAAAPASDDAASKGSTFSHDEWTNVLQKYVDERGYVDYRTLAVNRAAFDRYLARIRAHSPRSNPEMFPTRDHELAYWINAYNAHVIHGVLDRGPEAGSVWGKLLQTGKGFFVDRKVTLGNETTNLKTLEDDWIRAEYEDPRIHAAINCASKGCPRLPRTAFTGPELDEQLDAGMRLFVSEERNVEVTDGGETVELSKIFDWFEGDFTAEADSVIAYVNRYRDEDAQVPADAKIEYRKYDKELNAQDRPAGAR